MELEELYYLLPTVGIDQNNIYIEANETSLHNEFMKHNFNDALPINPENYNNDYIFVLDVDNVTDTIKTITTNDFKIYPLKSEFKDKKIYN